MQVSLTKPKPRYGSAAFTLVEMLVVIVIISILMTAGSIGLSGMGGKGVTSGVATAESLFDEARTTAISKNIRSCILVSKTLTNNPSEDLRRILVAYENVDPTTGLPLVAADQDPTWVLSSRGALLPDQTFFSAQYSKTDQTSGSGTLDTVTHSKLKSTAGASGKAVSTALQGEFYIYQFNSQGIAKYDKGASFIIGAGARNSTKAATGANTPKVASGGKRDFGGFVIWKNGRTSLFRSPEQMNIPLDAKEF